VDGLRTYSRCLGRGPDLVLVHGVGVSSDYWRPAQRALAARGFRVHALDLPGFGRSEDPPWPPELPRLSGHLLAWLREAVPGPCHLVGQSMGCDLVVLAAVAAPERVEKVVLAGPAGLPCLRSVFKQLLLAALDAPREPLSLYPVLVRDYLRCGPRRLFRMLWEQKDTLTDRRLGEVRQPVLVLRGEGDTVVSEARVLATAHAIPHAETAVVPGAHAAHFSHPETFAGRVAAFLQH
jgi:pimeloyl-ACP methyl ester carboxylesterase